MKKKMIRGNLNMVFTIRFRKEGDLRIADFYPKREIRRSSRRFNA